MATEAEIAWAAGLFEGEGCFSRQKPDGKTHGPAVSATMAMVDEETVRRFYRIVGAGRVVTRKRQNDLWKPLYVWVCTDLAGFQRVYDLLSPWLGSRRRARAQEILELHAHDVANAPRRCYSWVGLDESYPHLKRARCRRSRGHGGTHDFALADAMGELLKRRAAERE